MWNERLGIFCLLGSGALGAEAMNGYDLGWIQDALFAGAFVLMGSAIYLFNR